jgi:hypothetical protein
MKPDTKFRYEQGLEYYYVEKKRSFAALTWSAIKKRPS